MRLWIVHIILGCSFLAWGQSDTMSYQWKQEHEYALGDQEVWTVDVLENIIVSDNGLIRKYNASGALQYTQSIKSLGRTTQIVPINTMKLIHFSEDQQSLCYFDNTLSSMNDCIDLSAEGIVYATMIGYSNQPDKIWLLDNVNSRLLLMSLRDQSQQQEIKNLKGILNLKGITQIAERGNRLFLLDPERGIFVFDMYGSLIELIPLLDQIQVDAYENSLFSIDEKQLTVYAMQTGEQLVIPLPISGVLEFSYRNRFFYLRTSEAVHKYALQFSE